MCQRHLLSAVPFFLLLNFSAAILPQEHEEFCLGNANFDCGPGELRTRCISGFWICDNVFDCSTGMDEMNCQYMHNCPPGYFICRNGDCIPAKMRCDGLMNCLDNSDERDCHGGMAPRVPFKWPNRANSRAHNAPPAIGHEQQQQQQGWFSILSALLALLIIGQLLVLGFVCLRKKQASRFLLGTHEGGSLRQARVRFVPTTNSNNKLEESSIEKNSSQLMDSVNDYKPTHQKIRI